MSESAESDIQGAYVGAPCKLICVRKAATAAQLVVARPMGGTTLSAEGQYRGSAMESQEQSPGDVVTAGEDSHPITQAIDTVEVTHAGATAPAANTMNPPTIPLAPMKRMQARFNPLADGLMYVVVFVGGFVGVGCRHALDMLLPSVSGTPFVVGTFVSNMVACFLFAMLTEFMATASWLRRRVRQVVSRGVGLGLLGGLSTMSGVMLETMEGLHERHIASALGYLAGNFAGGLLTAAAGVVLMQALLSRSTRKRVRGAFSAVSVSDSAESDTQGVRHVKVADVARSAAQAAMEAAQTAQQIAQTGQVPRVETPTVPPTASQPMQTGRVPQIPPLAVPQLTQPAHPLLREPDTPDLGQLPEIQQSQPIQQPQQQSQPIQQPANPLPPSFEPKPITAEISLVADPTTGEVR
ncbi:CrcB family protein [Bifidobacterium longum]|uniref:fluoride efflux transporter FluC n=1 Tax=Bifidobacterium longum TaxID=216816 RepID=UPI001D06F5E5|nr:CrcB family protein [Bifidobacterium longum]MCB6167575.1 CrcB family protein [Bifidobacterium longum]